VALSPISPYVQIAVAAAAAACLFGAARSRRRWARVLLAGVAGLATVAGGLGLVNDHFRMITTWSDLTGTHSRDLISEPRSLVGQGVDGHRSGGGELGGARLVAQEQDQREHIQRDLVRYRATGKGVLIPVHIPGTASGVPNRSGYIYLPPQYLDPAYEHRSFPVVELFHGSPGIPYNWVNNNHADTQLDEEIAAHRAGPMVLVIPDTNGSLVRSTECVNAVHGEQDETYLVQDVPHWVRQRFRVYSPGPHWAVAGFSSGGFCAINLALRNPQRFGAAAAMDGYYHAIADRYARNLYRGNVQARLANSPDWRVQHLPTPRISMYLLDGTADPTATYDTKRFVAQVAGRMPITQVAQPRGHHNFADWNRATPAMLDWLSSQLGARE
jgi:S-formylglutathione hydrolase FrmB